MNRSPRICLFVLVTLTTAAAGYFALAGAEPENHTFAAGPDALGHRDTSTAVTNLREALPATGSGSSVTYLQFRGSLIHRLPAPRPLTGGQHVSRAYLGSTAQGEVYCGVARAEQGAALYRLEEDPGRNEYIALETDGLVALGRGAERLWVVGDRRLFRVTGTEASMLEGVVALGPFSGTVTLFVLPSIVYDVKGLAVDARGRPWIFMPGYLGVYLPTETRRLLLGEAIRWWRIGKRLPGNTTVISSDPEIGVWTYVYGVGKRKNMGLRHFDLRGSNEEVTVAVEGELGPMVAGELLVEVSEAFAQEEIPPVTQPHMTVDSQLGVLLAGESPEGAVLVQIKGDRVESMPIPAPLLQTSHVTAVATDPSGCVLLATDGVGVLVYDGRDWAVHEITQYLPVLEGTGLKPVDDILVADDGKLYAACQRQVVIWQANR